MTPGPVLSARWAFAFNFPCYAAGSGFAKRAEPADGIFDVCTYNRPGLGRGLGFYFRTVLFGRQIEEQRAHPDPPAESHFGTGGSPFRSTEIPAERFRWKLRRPRTV